MTNQPLVSIIVPIYNVEKYLRKCIQSLLDQSYQNYEIILVNDGSPDNCGEICDEFAKKSSKIKVLHLQNGGVCRARNLGMEIAKGEYFCFVDSDDWVEEDYLKDFVDNLVDEYTLIVQDAYRDLPNETQPHFFKFENNFYNLNDTDETIKMFQDEFFQTGFPWNKIYSKKIILENNLQFDPAIKLGDDEKWNLQYYKHINNIVCINKANYHYIYNPNSISNQARPFERELLRFSFRADFFNNLLSKHNNDLRLRKIISKETDVFFRFNIFDRLYKSEKDKSKRIEKLREITNLPLQDINLLNSDITNRNIDYYLLKKNKIQLLDFYKILRLKVHYL